MATNLLKTFLVYCIFIYSSTLIPRAESQPSVQEIGSQLNYPPYLAEQFDLSNDILAANAALQSAVAELQSTVATLQSLLAAQSSSAASNIAALQSKMTAQSNAFTDVVSSLQSNITALKYELAAQSNSSSNGISALKNQLTSVMQSPMMTMYMGKAIAGPMPTSCSDVQTLGWIPSGFYMVKSSTSTKVNTVYCDFSKVKGTTGYETLIGFNDVKKSTGVHFEVMRRTSYSGSKGKVIPYEVEKLNIGMAMNLTTGVFTAPTSGRYQFIFTGRSVNPGENYVTIRLNKMEVGMGFTFSAQSSMPFVTTMYLEKDDTVDTFMSSGSLFDNGVNFTRFIGILLEEDLSL